MGKGKPLNASRARLDRFVEQAAHSVGPGATVLDAGSGGSPYRHHFKHLGYESADFKRVDKQYADDITYVGDLSAIDCPDDRFDLVLITQVLEHLPEPAAALLEMRRVLKPGGRIWASAPLFYEEHEQPYDFYRYTQFGLRHLFDQAGFSDVKIEWLEGYWGTIAYELQVAARASPRPWGRPLRWASTLCARFELRRKVIDRGHPKNYVVVARA